MDEDKVFIPLSVENTNAQRTGYFMSTKKGILMALGILPSVIWVPLVANATPGSTSGVFVGVVTYGFFFIMFLRFIIFEEITWRRIFKNLFENKISTSAYFWGIDRIEESGIIHYSYAGRNTLRKGGVIQLIAGSKVGKGLDYDEKYREALRRITREALKEDLKLEIREMLDNKNLPNNIKSMYLKVRNIKDSLAREIALEHINNLAAITKNRKRLEITYLILYFDSPRKFKRIIDISNNIIKVAESTGIFKYTKILSKKEVELFISRTLSINTFPNMDDRFKADNFEIYGDIYRVFDEHGNEEWIEGGFDSTQNVDIAETHSEDDEIDVEDKDIDEIINSVESNEVTEEYLKMFEEDEERTEDSEEFIREDKVDKLRELLKKSKKEKDKEKDIIKHNEYKKDIKLELNIGKISKKDETNILEDDNKNDFKNLEIDELIEEKIR